MAEKDLEALRAMARGDAAESFDAGIVGFHAQQAAEKALKACLTLEGVSYDRTHDLTELIRALEACDFDMAHLEWIEALTPFAVQYRYEAPQEDELPKPREVLVRELDPIIAHVRTKLHET